MTSQAQRQVVLIIIYNVISFLLMDYLPPMFILNCPPEISVSIPLICTEISLLRQERYNISISLLGKIRL